MCEPHDNKTLKHNIIDRLFLLGNNYGQLKKIAKIFNYIDGKIMKLKLGKKEIISYVYPVVIMMYMIILNMQFCSDSL
ncbi:hypothetical protein AKUG0406_PLPX00140 (plasmid) [Apilactobacillus kunkeei]|nr:hypothetical protein AKUG0406_PLPX00140 [Apilactobacillus kunkeei]CAI2674721.1 hypothetical protein AKUG0403_PLPX00130 [Apilactobacillus kunkeei]CAI2677142.1 hypothetical protein AKUH3B111A_PLPX00120 [Apilactobacillus kunkeei]CAI2677225.1 hypothetical protein AKUH3B103M_PLPX00130 [Apilactobacillus kunkeei]CAI2677617.1 hypothetical protein AKUH3B104X_PLPX00130 [Apilactobacillus kunkeei]